MHTIKLKVHDDIYNHIIFLLKSLDKKKIEIIEDKTKHNINDNFNFSEFDINSFKEIKNPLEWQQDI
ncbi:hypothetical protein AFAEC_1975 [Aliarcobacter faecis]|uniref:hypothetical protein n=1 Tax=Aliarcobacter faecis TaxID=1564138 RepID=UPI00047BB5DD|nr:hypothetical protein [Aliarcobacter faecis]QKF74126.1 hypothetical protein AFAEC_1975 [Aliarcobacter faecis]